MPIYEYECSLCGHRLEAFQKMSDAPLINCPECNKPNLKKLISAAGFQLKGTGWYATDFRNKGKPEAQSAKKQTSKDTQTDSTTKTDSGKDK
jgi:putative FmdB family regulatory protein